MMLNIAYDVPLAPKWDFSFGGGAGTGVGNIEALNTPVPVNGAEFGYMYQGFAGFAYSLRRNIDITFDWRYRDLALNKKFGGAVEVKDTNEQACDGRYPLVSVVRAASSGSSAAASAPAASSAAAAPAGQDVHRLLRLQQVEPDRRSAVGCV